MINRTKLSVIAVSAVLAVALTGCGGSASSAPTFPWGMGVLIGVCCTAPLVRFFVRLAMKK